MRRNAPVREGGDSGASFTVSRQTRHCIAGSADVFTDATPANVQLRS